VKKIPRYKESLKLLLVKDCDNFKDGLGRIASYSGGVGEKSCAHELAQLP
jgi:hypothetical protein